MPFTLAGPAGTLWHAVFKFNTPNAGFSTKFHIKSADEATVRVGMAALAANFKAIMPSTSEIIEGRIHLDDTAPDGRWVPGCAGPGTYLQTGMSPPATMTNRSGDAVLMRFEHDAGLANMRKLGPIPDGLVVEDFIITPGIADIVGAPGAPAAAAAVATDAASWCTEFGKLATNIMFYCKAIQTGHAPGGPYMYANFVNAYAQWVAGKKGRRGSI